MFLCTGISFCAMLILYLNHIGEQQLFFYFTHYHYRPLPLFSFYVFGTLTVLFLFLGATIVCVNNVKRTADLVLWFPDKTTVCTYHWRLYNLIVLKASLNLTKLNWTLFNQQFCLHLIQTGQNPISPATCPLCHWTVLSII